jgi:tRNA A-37 threonylcarbamoyl transferase component Bud32
MAGDPRVGPAALPAHAWGVAATLVLCLLYAVLEVGVTRPRLPAAGVPPEVGVQIATGPILARPPRLRDDATARQAGANDGPAQIDAWRAAYWRGPGQSLDRAEDPRAWARTHLGMIVQVLVFIGAALILFVLRSNDLTAGLCVLALVLSGVAGGGPLLGAERLIPGVWPLLTLFAWLATPLAFPVIALSIAYFPSRSPLLVRYPLLYALPLLAAAPMIVAATLTSLYLVGVDAARGAALWDAQHSGVYFGSFAGALALNVVAVAEGVYRYRFNHSANERRRIRMAVYTAVPGVLAYVLKEGVAIAALMSGRPMPVYPTPVLIFLQSLVLLPAFGLVYAIGVARVLGPRVVLRRSLQYALANRTLTIVAMIPAGAFILSLARDSDRTIGDIVTSRAGVYLALIIAILAAHKYRERARLWLDQRFFRQEYDARKILLSLASRVRFETDPADLASMVVTQIDEALHPEMIAILVSGVEEGRLTPVNVLHGSAETLPLDGGLISMLRWSDEPLEIFLDDPRSPARRLPPEEKEWLECTAASLLVPVIGQDKALIGTIVLGAKRSEEAYTAEDRALLASIAAQMGLGFDVARLRRRMDSNATSNQTTRIGTAVQQPMMECPRCGRCEDASVKLCPADGAPLTAVTSVPRVIDNKYRLEQLIGRGGMGAVYRARDMRLERMVAVKVVRSELLGDPEARRRFRREAQIVAKLQHPSIVSVFDFGTFPDGGAYLVMELVRGEDLRRVLQREGRLDPERAVRILSSVCSAIEAAHREGVLHRDLKPENILLPGGASEAKVLDFGVAKVVADDRREQDGDGGQATVATVAGMIVGTPAYMAPEQLRGGTPDARTDVFSLGVIAYEMFTGELPFGRGSLAEVVLAQARGLPALSTPLPPAIERAIRSAVEPDPDRRPASPQAFAHLITAAVGI